MKCNTINKLRSSVESVQKRGQADFIIFANQQEKVNKTHKCTHNVNYIEKKD